MERNRRSSGNFCSGIDNLYVLLARCSSISTLIEAYGYATFIHSGCECFKF